MIKRLICYFKLHVFPENDAKDPIVNLLIRINSCCLRCGTDYMDVYGR